MSMNSIFVTRYLNSLKTSNVITRSRSRLRSRLAAPQRLQNFSLSCKNAVNIERGRKCPKVRLSPKTDTDHDTASIYVHWPYCKRRCTYCNFNKYIENNVDHLRMTKCLEQETKTLLELSGVKKVTSVFFGGGTPSLAHPSTIATVLSTIDSVLGYQTHREVTLEVNPTGFETAKLIDFQGSGVNRVSLGIQTLNPEGLAVLGREHSPAESLRCLEKAKILFDGRVSVDLIFGWPSQSLTNWLDELQTVLTLCDNHVSLYQLTLERGTKLFHLVEKHLLAMVDDETMEEMYLQAVEVLSKHGFERYEISNFVKQQSYCNHNISYWTGQQYIGIGPGAHGRFKPSSSDSRQARVQTLEPHNWMFEVEKFGHATRLIRPLTSLQQLEELLITGLRMTKGVSLEAMTQVFPEVNMVKLLQMSPRVLSHIQQGLLVLDSQSIHATEKGLNVIDSILVDLLCTLKDSQNIPGTSPSNGL